ncbi:MAG: hypothetical protein JNK48_34895 [Bryobacterales bacterium]|nr:hypothetical protein [Bryobacterales bacterium]
MKAVVLFLTVSAAWAQDFSGILAGASRQTDRNAKVTGLRFNCLPADCKVRPLESIVVQVLVDGEIAVANSDPRKGRLRRAPGAMKALDKDGGWVSKPFKFPGTDPGGFTDGGSAIGSIFQRVAGDFIVQDSFLYTAPEKAGTYRLESDTEGVKAQVTITVDSNAASQKKAEEFNFGAEDKSKEPYRALAERYAPMFAQETWWQPKSDFPTRFDFDNDLIGDNNWDNMEKGTSQAYIYYAVMETSTHWFLIYNAFHPRDYSDKCVAGSCHENDNEGVILTVQKDGSEFGKLLTMETLAHNNVYSFTNERGISSGLHNVDGRIEMHDNTHPVVFVESGGHGIYGTTLNSHSRYNVSKDDFNGGTGVTFVYKGVAERPKHANDRKVGYELLPILTHWWARTTNDQDQRMFDEFGPYEPFGGRPKAKVARMGKTFLGRKESSNKAKPFWGWHDNKTLKAKVLNAGQWGLDPAYAVTQGLRFPASMQFSLDYTYNPYLGIGDEGAGPAQSVVITPGTPSVGAPGNPANPANPEKPAVVEAAAVAAEVKEGWVEVEATVDASVVFHLWEKDVTPEVLAGGPVKDQKISASGPIPAGSGVTWSVEKKTGRGTVKIVEEPSAGNGNTLKVRVDDTKGGAARHVFRVTWKR